MKTVSKLIISVLGICFIALIMVTIQHMQQEMPVKLTHTQLVDNDIALKLPMDLAQNGMDKLHQASEITTTQLIGLSVSTTERPDTCSKCFPRPYKFVFTSQRVCQTASGKQAEVDLVIVVASAPDRREQRNLVRDTWASVTKNNTWNKARYIFLLGHSNLDLEITKENDLHGDMALQDFQDSYKNLTLKTLMGLEWFATFCPGAKNLMKTDDDVLIHIHNILHLIHRKAYNSSHVHGRCHPNKAPMRDSSSKWYTPFSMYPHAAYPPYCGGYGYILAHNIVNDILTISFNIPFFTWEDVYIGLCLKELGYNVRKVTGYRVRGFQGTTDKCSPYNQWRWCIAHGYKQDKMSWAWKRCVLPGLNITRFKS